MYRLMLLTEMEHRMKKRLLGLVALGAACAACCLPFIAAGLGALGLGSALTAKVAGVSLDAILCIWGPVFFLGAGAVILVAARGRRVTRCGCGT